MQEAIIYLCLVDRPDTYFVVSGYNKSGSQFYYNIRKNGNFNSGFVVSYISALEHVAQPIISYTASFANFGVPNIGASPDMASSTPAGNDPPAERVGSSGTGFFVSRTGLILTNAHVVDDCDHIGIRGYGDAELLRIDDRADLAALMIDAPTTLISAVFSDEEPVLGSSVIGGGYPLSDLLDNDFSVFFGKVTGRRGLGGDETTFSISAPVQPGNSGGPVVNSRGMVVGVIASKLNDAKMLEVTGSTGANFSFAIDGKAARAFLRPFALAVDNPVIAEGGELSDEEIVANMERYTVQVLCSVNR